MTPAVTYSIGHVQVRELRGMAKSAAARAALDRLEAGDGAEADLLAAANLYRRHGLPDRAADLLLISVRAPEASPAYPAPEGGKDVAKEKTGTRGGRRPGAGRPKSEVPAAPPIAVRLNEDERGWLNAEAAVRGVSASEVVRQLIAAARRREK